MDVAVVSLGIDGARVLMTINYLNPN